jgi:hypothetical protein
VCVCVAHCITTNVVTHFAFWVQSVQKKFQEDLEAVSQARVLRALNANERDVDGCRGDLLLDAEFVIAETLKLAVNFDYGWR